MSDLNKVILLGRLCRDPEVRPLPSGHQVAHFSIAVNRHYRDKQNQPREDVCFVDVDAFGKTAELIQKYFTKGKPIFIEGRLRLDRWETKDGKRSKLLVVADRFTFVPDGKGPQRAAQGVGEVDESGAEDGDAGPSDLSQQLERSLASVGAPPSGAPHGLPRPVELLPRAPAMAGVGSSYDEARRALGNEPPPDGSPF